jgi:hypothetical protein
MLFLDKSTMQRMGEVLGQHFTEGELNEFQDLLRIGGEGCGEAMDSYPVEAERYNSLQRARKELAALADAVEAGEIAGREDTPA